jgi:hypothetical protein
MTIFPQLLEKADLTVTSEIRHLRNGVYQVYVNSVPAHAVLAQRLHRVGLVLYGYGEAADGWEVRFGVNLPRRAV